jgi:uncharacterized cupin superfamily protein
MAKIFHIDDLAFKERKSALPEFAWQTSPRLAKEAGSKYFQFDIRSLDPGKFSFPYHFHRASEEMFLILSGEATLRSPKGFQKIGRGDLAFFEEGAAGAHQLYNHSDDPCVYLDLRAPVSLDVCEYPDSGKLAILPIKDEIFEASSKTDYYQGEDRVVDHWPAEILKK